MTTHVKQIIVKSELFLDFFSSLNLAKFVEHRDATWLQLLESQPRELGIETCADLLNLGQVHSLHVAPVHLAV